MNKILKLQNIPFCIHGYCPIFVFCILYFKIKIKYKSNFLLNTKKSNYKKTTKVHSNLLEFAYTKLLIYTKKKFKKKSSIKCVYQIVKFLFCKNFTISSSNFYFFGIQLLSVYFFSSTRILNTKLLRILIKRIDIHKTLIHLLTIINYKNKSMALVISETLVTIKDKFFKNLSFFWCYFLIYRNQVKIVHVLSKYIQKTAKKIFVLSSFELEIFMYIHKEYIKFKKYLGTRRYFLKILNNSIKTNAFFTPRLLLTTPKKFGRSKKYPLLVLKITKNFLFIYSFRIPVPIITETIGFKIRLIKKDKSKTIHVKTLTLCFKLKILKKKHIKNKSFFIFILIIKDTFCKFYYRDLRFLLNKLVFICKKIQKKALTFIVNSFLRENCHSQIIFCSIRGLLKKIKKKTSFEILLKNFLLKVTTVFDFSLEKKNSKKRLQIIHRLLELIICNFGFCLDKFFFLYLAKRLTSELNSKKFILKKQAMITIKTVLNKFKINNRNKFIFCIFVKILTKILYGKKSDILLESSLIFSSFKRTCIEYTSFFISLVKKAFLPPENKKFIKLKIFWKFFFKIKTEILIYIPKKWKIIFKRLSKDSEFSARVYSLCSIYKIAKKLGPIKTILKIKNKYKTLKKKEWFLSLSVFLLLFKKFGHRVCFSIFFPTFPALKSKYINIQFLLYTIWYLPQKDLECYCEIIYTIIEKISRKKKKTSSFYIGLGIFVRKIKTTYYTQKMHFVLLNIWADIYQAKKLIFRSILFAIEKICFFINNIPIKTILLCGFFHASSAIRKVYWYIYYSTRNKLNYSLIYLIAVTMNRKFNPI